MEKEITIFKGGSTLPIEIKNELQIISNSPGKYYGEVKQEGINDNRPINSPILSQIKRELGFTTAMIVVSCAIDELREWFNVKNNITPSQVAMTAEMILDNPHFYDFTIGNIKACFRQKMMNTKLYDRLDGNIIIQWLREFKSEMADRCELVSEGRDRKNNSQESDAISHEVYLKMLKHRADNGDQEAIKIIKEYRKRGKVLSQEEQHQKELEFFKYKQEYLKGKKVY